MDSLPSLLIAYQRSHFYNEGKLLLILVEVEGSSYIPLKFPNHLEIEQAVLSTVEYLRSSQRNHCSPVLDFAQVKHKHTFEWVDFQPKSMRFAETPQALVYIHCYTIWPPLSMLYTILSTKGDTKKIKKKKKKNQMV